MRWVVGVVIALAVWVGVLGMGPDRSRGGTAPAPAGGRILRVGVTPLPTFDPAQARSVEQLLVADQLFDSLTAADPTTLEPRPGLAARWEASADQRQWDFFLRPGAAFSDGQPVTAEDVRYSLERVARAGSGSAAAELLRPVSGYVDFRVKGSAPRLAGVSAPTPDQVHISLDEPWSELPSVLSSPVFGVVSRQAVEPAGPAAFVDQPVTSGPFRVRARRANTVSLAPSPGSQARVAGVDLVQVDDLADGYRAFVRGQLDWALVPPGQVDAAAGRYGRRGFRPYLAQLFYGFNLKSPALADLRFREAIVRAIDRRAIVEAVYQGTVQAADGVVLEGVSGHQPDPCPRCRHDPARARVLVAEAFPGGRPPVVGIDYDADPGQEAVARAIQSSLAQVGISATLRPKSPRDYDAFAVSGAQELFRLGWFAAYPSPDALLTPLFTTGSPDNLTGFSSPSVDQLLRTARAEGDPGRRTQLYRDAERAVMDQLPVIPIAQFELHAVVSERVRNLRTTSLGTFDASVVSLRGAR